jgi:hypothetical protein
MFFSEPEFTARKHFLQAVHQLSQTEGHKDNGRVSLPTLFGAVFPYMKKSELMEAIEFVNLPDVAKAELNKDFLAAEEEGGRPGKLKQLSEEKLEQLAELFQLYDIDGNGFVDVSEIRAALEENDSQRQTRNRLGSVVMNDQEEQDTIGKIVSDMKAVVGNGELNFEQFVEVFHDLLS